MKVEIKSKVSMPEGVKIFQGDNNADEIVIVTDRTYRDYDIAKLNGYLKIKYVDDSCNQVALIKRDMQDDFVEFYTKIDKNITRCVGTLICQPCFASDDYSLILSSSCFELEIMQSIQAYDTIYQNMLPSTLENLEYQLKIAKDEFKKDIYPVEGSENAITSNAVYALFKSVDLGGYKQGEYNKVLEDLRESGIYKISLVNDEETIKETRLVVVNKYGRGASAQTVFYCDENHVFNKMEHRNVSYLTATCYETWQQDTIATQNYVSEQLDNRSLSQFVSDSENRLVTDEQINAWDNKVELSQIPTKVGQLENDSDFATKKYVEDCSGITENKTGALVLSNDAIISNSFGGFKAGNNAYATSGGSAGNGANSESGFAGGNGAKSTTGGAVGYNAKANSGFAGGYNANAYAVGSVQLGEGTNNNSNSLQFKNTILVDGNGNLQVKINGNFYSVASELEKAKKFSRLYYASNGNYNLGTYSFSDDLDNYKMLYFVVRDTGYGDFMGFSMPVEYFKQTTSSRRALFNGLDNHYFQIYYSSDTSFTNHSGSYMEIWAIYGGV